MHTGSLREMVSACVLGIATTIVVAGPQDALAKPGKDAGQPQGRHATPQSKVSGHAATKPGGGQGRSKQQTDRWSGEWDAVELAVAGFGSAALLEALGGDAPVLRTGAKPLPPGIARKLARGKPLPPGIAKRRPDAALLSSLPKVSSHEWLEVGTALVLVSIGQAVVKEILRDVLH